MKQYLDLARRAVVALERQAKALEEANDIQRDTLTSHAWDAAQAFFNAATNAVNTEHDKTS